MCAGGGRWPCGYRRNATWVRRRTGLGLGGSREAAGSKLRLFGHQYRRSDVDGKGCASNEPEGDESESDQRRVDVEVCGDSTANTEEALVGDAAGKATGGSCVGVCVHAKHTDAVEWKPVSGTTLAFP
jgi:hypothetical protein